MSPSRSNCVRRALYVIKTKKLSNRSAFDAYKLSYGYVHRRQSGEVDIEARNGPAAVFSIKEETALAKWLS